MRWEEVTERAAVRWIETCYSRVTAESARWRRERPAALSSWMHNGRALVPGEDVERGAPEKHWLVTRMAS